MCRLRLSQTQLLCFKGVEAFKGGACYKTWCFKVHFCKAHIDCVRFVVWFKVHQMKFAEVRE